MQHPSVNALAVLLAASVVLCPTLKLLDGRRRYVLATTGGLNGDYGPAARLARG